MGWKYRISPLDPQRTAENQRNGRSQQADTGEQPRITPRNAKKSGKTLPLRDHRTGRSIAYQTIRPWQRTHAAERALRATGLTLGSLSEQHAGAVWTATREATANRAEVYRQQAGNHDPSGLIVLEFVSKLATHLLSCQRCHRTARSDPGTPEAWLLYAIGQQPQLKAALGPILRELGHKPATRPPGAVAAARRVATRYERTRGPS